ncbi:MAG: DinB family protein [Bacteroidetes bacterium]|nr:DinB family protein [Bacteroidota bacterium]MBU2583987.1 DinB family protein [Bacteroidota bacterium]
MIELLRDMYHHQAWADAEMWKSLEAHPGALENTAVQKCLHHMHLAQHAYLSIVSGKELIRKRFEDFSNMNELKEYARINHSQALVFIKECTDSKLAEVVRIPWLRNPQLNLPVYQALLQAAMHSHYHRGQNAARLKELGGEPLTTDIIAWYWKEKPEAVWE